MIREHKLKILAHSLKYIWILALPLARAFFAHKREFNFAEWVGGAWADILTLIMFLMLGWLRWRNTYVKFASETDEPFCSCVTFISKFPFIHREKKSVLQKQQVIPYRSISSVSKERGLVMRIFKAVRVNIDTSGGAARKPDMELLLHEKDLAGEFLKLKKTATKFENAEMVKREKFGGVFKPSYVSTVVFSFLFSSSLSGAAYVAVTIAQLGRKSAEIIMSGNETFSRVSEDMTEKIALKIPPIGIGIALIVIFMKLFSFVLNLLRYAKFEISNRRNSIRIKSGVITKREFLIIQRKINYTDLGQNLLMKLFGVASIHVNCAGYGNRKSEIPVFLPVMGLKNAEKTLDYLNIYGRFSKPSVRPKKSAIFKYIYPAVIMLAALWSVYAILRIKFPFYKGTLIFLELVFSLPIIWLMFVKIAAALTSGYSVDHSPLGDIFHINFCKGYRFYNITIKAENIVKKEITQSFFQRLNKKCDKVFYLRSDKKRKAVIKQLVIDNV